MEINKFFIVLLAATLFAGVVLADGDHSQVIEKAKKIIDNQVSCDKLSEDDLEVLGEYFMEKMHPGEAHEIMDQRMGGEGSESLRQAHITMGAMFYCGGEERDFGMMKMMGGGGMMRNSWAVTVPGGWMMGFWIFWWVLIILFIFILVLVAVLLIRKLNNPGKKRK